MAKLIRKWLRHINKLIAKSNAKIYGSDSFTKTSSYKVKPDANTKLAEDWKKVGTDLEKTLVKHNMQGLHKR
ncbi:hypothetical protein ING78_10620 [Ligilactobacillus salivarius]|uniref:hypothetical protein n=1 Tax=Ligilactobacillus salivarius TaxID=1624 RepID=UPI0018790C34|nr:hypothetical protein [Ligilactobacillus salivarius]MBE7392735.1 hypothetical protein [Ligilactobacillus salivarius]